MTTRERTCGCRAASLRMRSSSTASVACSSDDRKAPAPLRHGSDVGVEAQAHWGSSYVLNWLGATGTLLFISGLLTMLVLGISPLRGLRTYGRTIRQFNWAILTILMVFALAFVMQFSGQTNSLGNFLSQSGASGILCFLSKLFSK